jgi:SAM-dependent MidA family methyltransferase
VHQVTLSRGSLKEVYITLRGDRLATTLGEPSTSALAARLDGLGIELAEGQTAEISLGIEIWAAEMAEALDAGFVLTVDYGHLARELYSFEQRRRGTLTTYYRHTQTDTPLRRIGRQDITAQVDFTTVINSGRRAGLEVLGIATQGRFLSNLGLAELRRRLIPLELPRRQFLANNVGMLDLARPGGLGGFRVLAQGKKVGHPALWGFEASERAIAIARESPVPLLREDHLPLLEARYPHVGMELEGSWPFAHEVPEHGRL